MVNPPSPVRCGESRTGFGHLIQAARLIILINLCWGNTPTLGGFSRETGFHFERLVSSVDHDARFGPRWVARPI